MPARKIIRRHGTETFSATPLRNEMRVRRKRTLGKPSWRLPGRPVKASIYSPHLAKVSEDRIRGIFGLRSQLNGLTSDQSDFSQPTNPTRSNNMKFIRISIAACVLALTCLAPSIARAAERENLPQMISIKTLCSDPVMAVRVLREMCSHSPVRKAVIKELASDKEFVRDYNAEQAQRASQGAGG